MSNYHLSTTKDIKVTKTANVGAAYIVDHDNFPALEDITCYTLEVWEECMRVPHWHPNASELGYVVSGSIEVIIWRSPGETAMFTLTAGMCWFIPVASLHSLNNIGAENAKLLVGFSSGKPGDIDLPVAYNGIPSPLRDAYTSPHTELRAWKGTIKNPLVGKCPVIDAIHNVITGSPYGFDLKKVTPLFKDNALGSVVWGVKSNWGILEDISVLHAHLKPNVARDAIWYPDAGTLYVVSSGTAEFNIIIANQKPSVFQVNLFDYIYVPQGVLHTFINNSDKDFNITAFFTKADPQPEVSLSVATAFFPNMVRKAAMTQYGTETKAGDPLQHLLYNEVNPYLVPVKPK
jgi:oxalate decarboxylase/phosphoglucose isomerase-like protein (cupin superfamily)